MFQNLLANSDAPFQNFCSHLKVLVWALKIFEFLRQKKSLKSAVQHFNNFSFSLPSMEEFQVHDIQF